MAEYALVESIWRRQRVTSTYMAAMHQVVPPQALSLPPDAMSLGSLPRWVCLAGGGDVQQATPLTAAWILLLHAFSIFDNIEDGDIGPDQPQLPVWLNAAVGLVMTAACALNDLEAVGVGAAAADAIRRTFYPALLPMLAGQHTDLTYASEGEDTPRLESYWAVTEAKIGIPFGLVCWAAGRVTQEASPWLSALEGFGRDLGLLSQIKDDLMDLWPTPHKRSDLGQGRKLSLPVVYALNVLPPAEAEALRCCLDAAATSPDAQTQAREQLIASGAALYLTVQAEQVYQRALRRLDEIGGAAHPLAALRHILASAHPTRGMVC